MAGDIEALKKGAAPAASNLSLKTQVPAVSESLPKIKPAFPKIEMPAPPAIKKEEAETEIKSLTSPLPLSTPRSQPFETPIKKPIMPPETNSQSKMSAPPPSLPTEPAPLSRPATPLPRRSVTPPPLPPQQPSKMPPAMPSARPALPPLPPLPQKPAMMMSQTKSGGGKKMLWLGILAGLILIFIGGEIWWFFLRQKPTPPPQSAEILPPPQELQPLLPVETAPANTISPTDQELATPPTPPANGLLNYDTTTPIISLVDLTKLDNAIVNEEELVKLIVKVANPANDSVAAETVAEVNTIDELAASLKIKIPTAVKKEFSEEFDIFAFGGSTFDKTECARVKNISAKCYGPRLGLAVKVLDSSRISGPLKAWEKTMAVDLKPLILAKTGVAASAAFQTGTYQNQNIHYKNLPINTVTVEYALVDDVLIITTSKSAMLKAIDLAKVTRDSNELGQ